MNFSRWKTTDSSTSNVLFLKQSKNTAELLAFLSGYIGSLGTNKASFPEGCTAYNILLLAGA